MNELIYVTCVEKNFNCLISKERAVNVLGNILLILAFFHNRFYRLQILIGVHVNHFQKFDAFVYAHGRDMMPVRNINKTPKILCQE